MRHALIAAATLLALSAPCLAQPIDLDVRKTDVRIDPRKDITARTELLAIDTLTLSDHQFLMGPPKEPPKEAPKDGTTDATKEAAKDAAKDAAPKSDAGDVAKPTTLSGVLRIAQGDGRLPVVVLMHGSGGMGANIETWSRTFNAMGISTFAIDGFTGRGLTGVSTDQAALGRLNFIFDMYRALAVLANHPRVDRTRVALMGFSRGGQAALYAAMNRFDKFYWNKSGVEVAAYVAFYPDCMTTYIGDTDMVDHPIRIFGGTIDDYNPIARCKEFVTRLREAHRDVELTEYPNAPHGFDNPLGATTPTVAKNAQTVRNCVINEETKGVLINKATGKPFSYADACVERDPHVGYDPDATASAKLAVEDFLRAVFRLD